MIVGINPGTTSVKLSSKARAQQVPEELLNVPEGLQTLRMTSFEVDEWRYFNGWPVGVPNYDIRGEALVSAKGEVLAGRDNPESITTNAGVRWIASPEYFDIAAMTWSPLQGGDIGLNWESSVEYSPSLMVDYEYRIKDEVFRRDALNFDSDTRDHMWLDLGPWFPVQGYTVVMVLSPNSAYGNNQNVPYNGIWCYGRAPGEGDEFEETPQNYMNVTVEGNHIYVDTEQTEKTKGPGIAQYQGKNNPMYLAIAFSRPEARIYVGSGPDDVKYSSIATGTEINTLDRGVLLGRSTGDVLHTADMALFDLGVYPDSLSSQQIKNEFATLSQIYGGAK